MYVHVYIYSLCMYMHIDTYINIYLWVRVCFNLKVQIIFVIKCFQALSLLSLCPEIPTKLPESESIVTQLCPALCNPTDCSLPVTAVDGIL